MKNDMLMVKILISHKILQYMAAATPIFFGLHGETSGRSKRSRANVSEVMPIASTPGVFVATGVYVESRVVRRGVSDRVARNDVTKRAFCQASITRQEGGTTPSGSGRVQ